MKFQFGSDNNDGTTRVIDAFSEQVLTETSALALKHVAEGFERAVASASNGAAVTTVVEQRIDRFLQHAFFVANNHVRRFELEEIFQTIVAVDNAAIEIVEIGSGETATFERNQRTQIRRNDRQYSEDHPF